MYTPTKEELEELGFSKPIIDIPGGQSYHNCTHNNDRLDTRYGYNNSLDSENYK